MTFTWSKPLNSGAIIYREDDDIFCGIHGVIESYSHHILARVYVNNKDVAYKKFELDKLEEAKSWVEHELPFQIIEEEKRLFEQAFAFRKRYKSFTEDCFRPGGVYCSEVEEN